MAKRTDPLVAALENGQPYTWTVPDGGDLASMRAAIKHGQTLTMTPIGDAREVQARDMVLVRWHTGYLFHLVEEIQGDQFLIANSVGKVNGWVSGGDILGRVTHIVEPEPRPDIPMMLEQLANAYSQIIACEQPERVERERLLSVVEDMRWYADRIGKERWSKAPRQNVWSFEQRLWNLTKRVREKDSNFARQIHNYIDRGKVCVGLVAELVKLWESAEE